MIQRWFVGMREGYWYRDMYYTLGSLLGDTRRTGGCCRRSLISCFFLLARRVPIRACCLSVSCFVRHGLAFFCHLVLPLVRLLRTLFGFCTASLLYRSTFPFV
jgi:hypothetical protein